MWLLASWSGAAALAPTSGAAQTASLEGRVLEAGTSAGIQNALVELIGHGAVLTTGAGTFRFQGVEPRGYVLRVDAFGYEPVSRFVAVRGEVYEEVELDIAPLALDSLVVEPRRIDIDGRVRDPQLDVVLVDVPIYTNQVLGTETNDHGRFELEDVIEDVPLRVLVQAVGYLPVDTVVLPDEDEHYVFDLVPDPLAEALIRGQVNRLEERAAPRLAYGRRGPMNRERLLRWAGHSTLWTVIAYEYRSTSPPGCVFVDERQVVDLDVARSMLEHMIPEELERIEWLFDGGMLRIYTRAFIGEMTKRRIALVEPYMYQPPGGPPVCR